VTLYPFQRDAVDAVFAYLSSQDGAPLISLPTGSGKSHVQAAIIREVLDQWPNERFLLLTHVKELITQNASKLADLSPSIYSAGLGKKEVGQITIAGIQSVHSKAHEMGDVSIVIIDESHLVSKTGNSMYRRFLADLKKICPKMRLIGMSATPYRLDSGPLVRGDERIFTDVAYHISIRELIEQGYLSPIISAPAKKRIDTSGVKKRGGEFVLGELAAASMEMTEEALDESIRLAHDRKAWLVFCVTVEHAKSVFAALMERGIDSAVVVGETPKAERESKLRAFKDGYLRALVSVGVLTTGFDAPNADALICLRPTESPGLWVQMVGRLTRKSPGKTNGLVLDYTDNTHKHGPVDLIDCDSDGNVRTAPCRICTECGALMEPGCKVCECGAKATKECPSCKSLVDKAFKQCPDCGQWFIVKREPKHRAEVSGGAILSSEPIEVDDWDAVEWQKKDKPDSMRVTYWAGLAQYSEWICLEHGGYAAGKAATWWYAKGGKTPVPATVKEAIKRWDELKMPEKILVEQDGKYKRIKEFTEWTPI